MNDELATQYERLRRDTARLLNYDIANLTPAKEVRLDRVSALRLEVDHLQMLQLSGQPFDLSKLIAASEMLERLLSPSLDLRASYSGDFAKFDKLLEGVIAAREYEPVLDEPTPQPVLDERPPQPMLDDPPQPTPPPSAKPPPPRQREIPAHYLKSGQPAEPWRDYIDSGGNIITPRRWS